MNIPETIRHFVQAHQLTGPGLLAVSGGADSIALLRGMLDAKIEGCHVVHVNHQSRGADSDDDAEFVQDTGVSLKVPATIVSINITKLAHGENWEATARRIRYLEFEKVARRERASWVATGHTADDQAETVLHHLIRGSGLSGLRGIAPIRKLGDSAVSVFRPMLNITRKQVEAYLAELGQDYRTDATNFDAKLTRNRIRHELLPMLRTFNVGVDSALLRTAEHVREVTEYLHEQALQLLQQAEQPRIGNRVILSVNALSLAPQLLRCEVYRLIWEREQWPVNAMTRTHWLRVDGVTTACDFPDGVHVRRVRDVVQLSRDS